MAKKTKAKRIEVEDARIREVFHDLPADLLNLYDGLIRRAAYMRVTLEDYEADLDANGYVESFTQSEKTDPYERERPVARLYNTMNKNYQSIMKQLAEKLPEPVSDDAKKDIRDFINA
jgi:hypothetical protein